MIVYISVIFDKTLFVKRPLQRTGNETKFPTAKTFIVFIESFRSEKTTIESNHKPSSVNLHH